MPKEAARRMRFLQEKGEPGKETVFRQGRGGRGRMEEEERKWWAHRV